MISENRAETIISDLKAGLARMTDRKTPLNLKTKDRLMGPTQYPAYPTQGIVVDLFSARYKRECPPTIDDFRSFPNRWSLLDPERVSYVEKRPKGGGATTTYVVKPSDVDAERAGWIETAFPDYYEKGMRDTILPPDAITTVLDVDACYWEENDISYLGKILGRTLGGRVPQLSEAVVKNDINLALRLIKEQNNAHIARRKAGIKDMRRFITPQDDGDWYQMPGSWGMRNPIQFEKILSRSNSNPSTFLCEADRATVGEMIALSDRMADPKYVSRIREALFDDAYSDAKRGQLDDKKRWDMLGTCYAADVLTRYAVGIRELQQWFGFIPADPPVSTALEV